MAVPNEEHLIRLLMAQAALLSDQIPRQLSFKHTVQVWLSWQQRSGPTQDAVSIHALLLLIAEPRVGLRPGRIEPRAVKRRPQTVSAPDQTPERGQSGGAGKRPSEKAAVIRRAIN